MTTSYIPAATDLGPDPEPLPHRFEALLARHAAETRRPAANVAQLQPVPVTIVAATPEPAPPALAA